MSETRDATQAAALNIAERWLITQGWKFTPAEVGKRAKEVLAALDAKEPTP
jgi:hypothetical protein